MPTVHAYTWICTAGVFHHNKLYSLPYPPTQHYSMLCYTVSVQDAALWGVDLQSNKTAKSVPHTN